MFEAIIIINDFFFFRASFDASYLFKNWQATIHLYQKGNQLNLWLKVIHVWGVFF